MPLFLVCLKILQSLTTFQAFDTTISKIAGAGDRYRILNNKQIVCRAGVSCHFIPCLSFAMLLYSVTILHPMPPRILANIMFPLSSLLSVHSLHWLAAVVCLTPSTCRITCMLSYLCWSRGIRNWRTTLNDNLSSYLASEKM